MGGGGEGSRRHQRLAAEPLSLAWICHADAAKRQSESSSRPCGDHRDCPTARPAVPAQPDSYPMNPRPRTHHRHGEIGPRMGAITPPPSTLPSPHAHLRAPMQVDLHKPRTHLQQLARVAMWGDDMGHGGAAHATRIDHGVSVHTHLPTPACCHYARGPGHAARAPSGVWQLVLAANGVVRCGRVGPTNASTPPSMMLATPRAPSGTPLHAPPSVFPKPCDEWCQARCSMAGHSCADLRTAATRTRRLDCGGFAREWHCAAKGGGSPDGPRRVWPSICAPGNASIVPVPTRNRVRGSPPS